MTDTDLTLENILSIFFGIMACVFNLVSILIAYYSLKYNYAFAQSLNQLRDLETQFSLTGQTPGVLGTDSSLAPSRKNSTSPYIPATRNSQIPSGPVKRANSNTSAFHPGAPHAPNQPKPIVQYTPNGAAAAFALGDNSSFKETPSETRNQHHA